MPSVERVLGNAYTSAARVTGVEEDFGRRQPRMPPISGRGLYPVYQRVVSIQAAVVVIAAGAAAMLAGAGAAIATAYGGALAIANTGMLGRRVELAGELAKKDPKRGAYALYAGAVQRFVLVLAGLGLGMGWLKLQPFPLLIGLALGQGAQLAVTARQALRPTPTNHG